MKMNKQTAEKVSEIVRAVQGIYDWLYVQTPPDLTCGACGRCCDFDAYDHRLYITTPELLHFVHSVGPENIKEMPAGVCPFRVENKCTVHNSRFAACRIFFCKQDPQVLAVISETAVENFKYICRNCDIPYTYTNLQNALKNYREILQDLV